ncbi:MAG: hypothetical protein GTN78_25035, partial [Gemmatimonadales bacterium]|nr:hypothetical protein [Stutzerimonas stutzeri]NIR03424.1 hypothetical protein [Gemmatimonadales bacterium]NIS58630.1 hypothetical protein [Stutzerimonas stutzeri]
MKADAGRGSAPAVSDPARRGMRVVVVCYIFLAIFVYVPGIPLGKGPDESAHVRYVEFLAENHRMPVFDAENPDPDYEFHQPPLYYALCLPSYLLAGRGTERAAQVLRFFTVLLSLALLYLTFALGRMLAPSKPWTALAAAGAVAFLPMQLTVASSVGNDALAEIWCAITLLVLVGYLRAAATRKAAASDQGLGPWPMAAVGLAIGLGLLTKSLTVLLFPVAWVAALLAAGRANGYDWRQLARDVALSTGVALAVSGWWLVRNQLTYGDLLAQRAFLDAFQGLRPSPQSIMAEYEGRLPRSLHSITYVQVVIVWTLASALGVFGPKHGNHFLFYPYWVYLVYGLLGLAGAL